MKTQHKLRRVVQNLIQRLPLVVRRYSVPLLPPEQLPLGLDHLTESGLSLRAALPVRSAEYWLQLGHPSLALKELQTLPDSARRNPWPQRVHLQAIHATNH